MDKYNLDNSQKHSVEWKKPVPKGYTLYYMAPFYTTFSNRQNYNAGTDQWLQKYGLGGGGDHEERTRDFWGVTELFCILIMVVATQNLYVTLKFKELYTPKEDQFYFMII